MMYKAFAQHRLKLFLLLPVFFAILFASILSFSGAASAGPDDDELNKLDLDPAYKEAARTRCEKVDWDKIEGVDRVSGISKCALNLAKLCINETSSDEVFAKCLNEEVSNFFKLPPENFESLPVGVLFPSSSNGDDGGGNDGFLEDPVGYLFDSINNKLYVTYLRIGLGYTQEEADESLTAFKDGTDVSQPLLDQRSATLVERYKDMLRINGDDSGVTIFQKTDIEATGRPYRLAAAGLLVLGLMWQGLRIVIFERPQGLAVVLRGIVVIIIVYAAGSTLALIAESSLNAYAGYILEESISSSSDTVLALEKAIYETFVGQAAFLFISPIMLMFLIFSVTILKLTVAAQEFAAVFLAALLPFAAAGQFTQTTRPWLIRLIRAVLAIFAFKAAMATGFAVILHALTADDETVRLVGFIAFALLPLSLPAVMRIFAFAGVGGSGDNPAGNSVNEYSRVRVMAGMTDYDGTFKYNLAYGEQPPPHPANAGRIGAAVGLFTSGENLRSAAGAMTGRVPTGRGRLGGISQRLTGRDVYSGSNVTNYFGENSHAPVQASTHAPGNPAFGSGGPPGGTGVPGGAGTPGGPGAAGGGGENYKLSTQWTPPDGTKGRLFKPSSGLSPTPMGLYAMTQGFNDAAKISGKSLSGESAMIDDYDDLDWNNPDQIFDAS